MEDNQITSAIGADWATGLWAVAWEHYGWCTGDGCHTNPGMFIAAKDNTITFGERVLQLERSRWRASLASCTVTIHEHLNGTLSVRYGPHLVGRFTANGAPLSGEKTKKRRGCGKVEISQTTRDSHIPTAPARRAWKSGKPKAGFPLSHAGLATMNRIYKSKDLKHHNRRIGGPTERKDAAGSPFRLPRFQDHLVLESKGRFSIILRLENAEPASTSPARLNLKQRNLAAKKNSANSEVSPSAVSQNLTRCTGLARGAC
jgi:hypothetical protein